jgi:hypothetical protein
MDQTLLPARSVAANRFAFALVVALHLLVIMLWPQLRPGKAGAPAVSATDIVFVAAPVVRKQAPAIVPSRPARQRPQVAPKQVDAAVETAITIVPATPADEFELPREAAAVGAPSAADIMDRARRDMVGIDRAVRKQSLDMAVREFKLHETKLETAIASAYRGGGDGMRIVETVLADGTRMSKIIIGKTAFCAYKESNGLTGGRDVFRDGVRTKVTNCPN